ncbi:MAG: helix-turn-helix domain-containing protein [Candidatus Omnitrophota bacterium]|nr:helix-turn-helix domain-containing protein [Candidatus Omnitrophota bacterium]
MDNKELVKSIEEIDLLFLKGKEGKIYHEMVSSLEKSLIEAALRRTFFNQLKAAKILGINRNTLRTKIKRLGILIQKEEIVN